MPPKKALKRKEAESFNDSINFLNSIDIFLIL